MKRSREVELRGENRIRGENEERIKDERSGLRRRVKGRRAIGY